MEENWRKKGGENEVRESKMGQEREGGKKMEREKRASQ